MDTDARTCIATANAHLLADAGRITNHQDSRDMYIVQRLHFCAGCLLCQSQANRGTHLTKNKAVFPSFSVAKNHHSTLGRLEWLKTNWRKIAQQFVIPATHNSNLHRRWNNHRHVLIWWWQTIGRPSGRQGHIISTEPPLALILPDAMRLTKRFTCSNLFI